MVEQLSRLHGVPAVPVLNLNSLNDERISRVVNAVTPESSPLPTPVHRKEEYKIDVLIPPNISDPLNLNAEDDSDYEAKAKLLISLLVKKKVWVRKRPCKPLLSVDLSHLPGPVPELEVGHDGDISETDEEEALARHALVHCFVHPEDICLAEKQDGRRRVQPVEHRVYEVGVAGLACEQYVGGGLAVPVLRAVLHRGTEQEAP